MAPLPRHPRADKARWQAEQARKVAPHLGLVQHLATVIEETADELDRQYRRGNIFIPIPRIFQRRKQ